MNVSIAICPVEQKELPEIHEYNEDAHGCSWQWDQGSVSLQVTREPSGNRFDTWASRMVAARLEKGFVTIDGPGDGAAFSAEDSHLFWYRGERWLFSLSFAGQSREAKLDQASLVASAHRVADR